VAGHTYGDTRPTIFAVPLITTEYGEILTPASYRERVAGARAEIALAHTYIGGVAEIQRIWLPEGNRPTS
jgi:hypothetical protein